MSTEPKAEDEVVPEPFVCGGFNCPCNEHRPCRDPKCPHYEPERVGEVDG